MSTTDTTSSPIGPPSSYTEGSDRYIRFAEDFLGVELAGTQKRILRSLADNKRTLVVSGNGPGKSYGVSIAVDSFMCTNTDSTGLGTSGSYSQFIDGMWRPMKNLFEEAQERYRIPGKTLTGQQPRLEIDDDWYFRVVAPRDPGDLEGRHAEQTIVVIEEADKKFITGEHFSSSRSTVTSAQDRMLAVANPPKDESGVVYEKMQSDQWNVIQFSSFESHNVQVDLGEIEGEHLPGLVDLPTIVMDWEEYHDTPWPKVTEHYPEEEFGEEYPGVDTLTDRVEEGLLDRERVLEWLRPGAPIARDAHLDRNDLAEDWYRRRAGVIPPAGASAYRPFYHEDVKYAVNGNERPPQLGPLLGIGIDIARKGGDSTVYRRLYRNYTDSVEWTDERHPDNEVQIRELLDSEPNLPPIAVDAVGEGSGIADRLQDAYQDVFRFKNGSKPNTQDGQNEYYNKWTEALDELGDVLPELAIEQVGDTQIRDELFTAARVVKFSENRRRSGDVIQATPKTDIAERLDHSPDTLDALAMAAWAASDAPGGSGGVSKSKHGLGSIA